MLISLGDTSFDTFIFFPAPISTCDWPRKSTQADGQPAASATVNVDAPIAEEPEAEMEAATEAVCTFVVHHMIISDSTSSFIGLISPSHDFARSSCRSVCLCADNLLFSYITPLSPLGLDDRYNNNAISSSFASFLEMYCVFDISILVQRNSNELLQPHQCLENSPSCYRCLQSSFLLIIPFLLAFLAFGVVRR